MLKSVVLLQGNLLCSFVTVWSTILSSWRRNKSDLCDVLTPAFHLFNSNNLLLTWLFSSFLFDAVCSYSWFASCSRYRSNKGNIALTGDLLVSSQWDEPTQIWHRNRKTACWLSGRWQFAFEQVSVWRVRGTLIDDLYWMLYERPHRKPTRCIVGGLSLWGIKTPNSKT